MSRHWSNMETPEGPGRTTAHVRYAGCLAFLLMASSGPQALAQVFPQPSREGAYVSTSGTLAVGFPSSSDGVHVEAASNLPANVAVQGSLRGLAERMWVSSPTFRRQCARIAEASLTVTIEMGFMRHGNTVDARPMTRIRSAGGRLSASVRLGEGQYDYSEFVAHEIEHILEQVDGVDLPSALVREARGVHQVDHGAFETDRARAVGRQVAREVNGGR